MKPFMFAIKATPKPENEQCADIAGANVHIWVMADYLEEARERALAYIATYLWDVQTIEHELEIQPEQIAGLHVNESLLFQKAVQHGIGADFLAYPKHQGNADDPVKLRVLDLPNS